MLWWLHGLKDYNKDGFLWPPGLRHKHDMMATWGRPRTTRVICWLQWLTEYQHGVFCVRRG